MLKILRYLVGLVIGFILLIAIGVYSAVQSGDVSKSDLKFLLELGQSDGPLAVYYVVKTHLFGVDLENASDPGYGREQVAGRGNAPWVVRSNLDGRTRVLNFALAPELWAAYNVETLSLYQVWKGGINFAGSAYDYQHGPQPVSTGQWYYRDTGSANWFIVIDGEDVPAESQYLGHEYGPGNNTAAMRYRLQAGDVTVELTEWPDVADQGNQVTRRFERISGNSNPVGFYTGDGTRHLAEGSIAIALLDGTDTAEADDSTSDVDAGDSEIERGQAVIAGSDCLGCHAEHHRVAGPAWSQISGKFRGKIQQEVVSVLTQSVLKGSTGTWGQIPMPAHPTMSETDAREAVIYILSIGEPEEAGDAPLDPYGNPYASTYEYDILPRLTDVHPSFQLENIAPPGFEPKVGGMKFRSDGKLVLASWDLDGAVYLIDPQAPVDTRVKRIGEGLHEPLGLTVVDDRIFVMQKQELTELVDTDGDEIIDVYRAVSYDWQANPNFHSFAFGLEHKDDAFYFLLSICVLPGGASCPEQNPTQGKLLKVDDSGSASIIASGFRTPNGIMQDEQGALYVTDNQGDWLPSSKLLRIEEDHFYGSRAVPQKDVMALEESPPLVWLPQNEVGNSPTQPLFLNEGPYAGQMIFGDVYNGGIKRVFLEKVEGQEQGAAFHFSAGFIGAVNRLERGPDNAIYVGETGNPPNWGEFGKLWHGLEKLTWQGNNAFEMRAVRATETGFDIELTQALADDIEPNTGDLTVKQWFYHPNEQYGGPKYNEHTLSVSALRLSSDRKTLHADIAGLQEGYIVYLRLNDRLRSNSDAALWTAEAWYTLNQMPGDQHKANNTVDPYAWRDLFDGKSLAGWRNYGKPDKPVEKWAVVNGELSLQQGGMFPMWGLIKSVLFGGGSSDLIYAKEKFRDFELSLEWKISENGNSGIFYLVADEEEKTPWLTGIEMQVLHNEGHSDGQIETHRAGDLYDLIAAQPETVKPPGEWNEVRIKIQNNHIEHWLNGVKVVEVERGSRQWNDLVATSKYSDMPRFGKADEGYIVLQDHGDPVWYRNIRVRALPPVKD